ncbi:MAG: hypothetical protein AAB573_02675 [Patescibacteria group bacterium]
MSEKAPTWRTRGAWAGEVSRASVDVGIIPQGKNTPGYNAGYIARAGYLRPALEEKFPGGTRRVKGKLEYDARIQIEAADNAVNFFAKNHADAQRAAWLARAQERILIVPSKV